MRGWAAAAGPAALAGLGGAASIVPPCVPAPPAPAGFGGGGSRGSPADRQNRAPRLPGPTVGCWVGSAWTTPEAVLTGSRPPASGAEQALRPAAGAAIREVAARRRSRAPTERLREESTGIPLPRPQPCVPRAGRTWPPETGARSGAGYRRTVTATISLQPVPARSSGPWVAVIRLREASLRRQRPRAFRDVLLGLGQGASRLGPAAAPLRHAGTRARTLPAWRTLDPPPPTGRRRWARWWAGCGRTGPRLRALRAEAAGDSDGWPGSWRGRGSAFPAPDRRASRGAPSKIGSFRLWHQTYNVHDMATRVQWKYDASSDAAWTRFWSAAPPINPPSVGPVPVAGASPHSVVAAARTTPLPQGARPYNRPTDPAGMSVAAGGLRTATRPAADTNDGGSVGIGTQTEPPPRLATDAKRKYATCAC